jgi:hypothetical protein
VIAWWARWVLVVHHPRRSYDDSQGNDVDTINATEMGKILIAEDDARHAEDV